MSTKKKVTVVGNGKGGVGKSLIACNLAVVLSQPTSRGKAKVLLIDGDVQSSASMFHDMRAETLGGETGYDCVSVRGPAIRNQMKSFREKYDHIIVDCGGRDNPSLRAAVTVADRLIIPVPPRSVDEWALSGMVDLVREAREMINPNLQGFILVNLADAQGSDNDAVKSAIRDDYLTGPEDAEEAEAWTDPNIRILDPVIINRKPFANAFGAGLSIVEYRPADRKAVDEFLDVIDAVYTPDSQRHKNVYPLNSNRAA